MLVAVLLVAGAAALWWSDRDAPPVVAAAPVSSVAVAVEAAAERPPAGSFVLAISWHPAFCEARSRLPECRGQRESDYEATNLTLHGLWPDDEYCGVSDRILALDEANRWDELPRPELSDATWRDLRRVMPGTADNLHRHEWIVHGTCAGASAERYFKRSIALLEEINGSAVGELLAKSVGRQVSRNQIRAAFDAAFGAGAGRKVRLDCATDGKRTLLTELRINLEGDGLGTAPLRTLIQAARNAGNGCAGGIVDPVGLQ
jgi:ribonuclease T2